MNLFRGRNLDINIFLYFSLFCRNIRKEVIENLICLGSILVFRVYKLFLRFFGLKYYDYLYLIIFFLIFITRLKYKS